MGLRGSKDRSSSTSIAAQLCPRPRISAATSTSSSLGQPEAIARRTVCKYGSRCYQTSQEHAAKFAHPGDRDYRSNGATFEGLQRPELETLWDVFTFHDQRGSGNLSRHEFEQAIHELCTLSSQLEQVESPMLTVDVQRAWADVGGEEKGHVGFVRFVSWAARLCSRLPIGLDPMQDSATARKCRASSSQSLTGTACCECLDFKPSVSGSVVCVCGHRACLHRSETANKPFGSLLISCLPPHWERGKVGLSEVRDKEVLSKLQLLLDATHKETDNWTRDRGCKIHGVNSCKEECIYNNRAPVPQGYRLIAALRNQNPRLWLPYSLTRAAIAQQCVELGGLAHVPIESSQPPFDNLTSGSGSGKSETPLMSCVNEWHVFHGSSESSCRDICDRNFNLTMTGTGATWKDGKSQKGMPLYGQGFYCAERITKADEYACPGTSFGTNVCCVLLCRAVGGRVNICTRNEIDVARLREQIFHGIHHSVIGDRVRELGKPYREIVIYDKDQLYPEHLLFYERVY